MKKKITIILKIKRRNKGTEGRQTLEPEKAHSMGKFLIMVQFDEHMLHRLASNLSNVIRQVGR